MKWFAAFAFFLMSSVAFAQGKPCDELKGEIAKKLDDKGVKAYSLEVLEKDKESDAKVVGTCEAGKKKIVYKKESAAPKSAEKSEKKS